MSEWIVVTDFDGTLTEKDVGNEICKCFRPKEFAELTTAFRNNTLTLREFQQRIWTGLPANKDEFIQAALRSAALRPGVNEFLEACLHKEVPVYIASCGMDVYIENVIERFFSKFAQAAIKGISSNQTVFTDNSLATIIAPNQDLSQPEPLHKGLWAQELAKKHRSKIMAIGNGSSDKTFLGFVDLIFATEKLKQTCEDAGQAYTPFENFFDILKKWPLK